LTIAQIFYIEDQTTDQVEIRKQVSI